MKVEKTFLWYLLVVVKMEGYLKHIFDEVDASIQLDEEQKEVVQTEGDLLVIAGAGSGKTTTMVAKVKYLVEIKKVNPQEILLISYTNKATEELEMRIQKGFGLPISILTFHKLGLQILNQKNKKTIKSDSQELIQKMILDMWNQKKWKLKICIWARKYKSKKDLSKLIHLTTIFIKNYKMKGKPNLESLKLSPFWKLFFQHIIEEYEQKMQKENWIDFEDMIEKASKEVENISFPYRYVIVDEYQDISQDRFSLLLNLKEKFKFHLIVVGDDWQSIFGFSGSEINLFTQFQTYFPKSQQLKITNTYRNSQQLIDLAGKFVMKNSLQIKKQLFSSKQLNNPILLCPYQHSFSTELKKILAYISKLREFSTVFLLGRYHNDFKIEEYPYLQYRHSIIVSPLFPNLKIEFLTVHSAKGLGADEVILLNANRGIYGFPTNKKTDSILKKVESIDKSYPYAEERRLFYVALTRTKNHVFILYLKNKKSVFLKEIEKEPNVSSF